MLTTEDNYEGFSLHNEILVKSTTKSIPKYTDNRQTTNKIDEFVVSLSNNPKQFDLSDVTDLISSLEQLSDQQAIKFIDIIISAFASFVDSVEKNYNVSMDEEEDVSAADLDNKSTKALLEMYTFSLYLIFEAAESHSVSLKSNQSASTAATKTKGVRGKQSAKESDPWKWQSFRMDGLSTLKSLLSLDLKRIIMSAPDRLTLVSLVVKTSGILMEDPENIKSSQLKNFVFQIWALSVHEYENVLEIRKLIMQNLNEDHLAEPMADFLSSLSKNYSHTSLFEQVANDIKDTHLTDKDLKQSKPLSRFLVRLSQVAPKELLKSMVYLKSKLDEDSYTLRCGMIEVLGNLIVFLIDAKESEADNTSNIKIQIDIFYDMIEERFRDTKAFVRVKVLQTFGKMTSENKLLLARRMSLFKLAAGRLNDTAINVRVNALKLLIKLVEACPFLAFKNDNAKLSDALFKLRLQQLDETFKSRYPSESAALRSPSVSTEPEGMINEESTASSNDQVKIENSGGEMETDYKATEDHVEESSSGVAELARLRSMYRYYSDALVFCEIIKSTVPICTDILASQKKAEVVEAMNYLVTLHIFGVEAAAPGIRKMVHKVWDKEVTQTKESTGASNGVKAAVDPDTVLTKNIRDHLAKCYSEVYLRQYPPVSGKENSERSAQNLIRLTEEMTLAELTSLEQLLMNMVTKSLIDEDVIEILWLNFCSKKISPIKRRGALMIFSMMGKARQHLISSNLEMLFKVGLGVLAEDDLILAKHSCIALQHLGKVGKSPSTFDRMPMQHPLFSRLFDLLLKDTTCHSWFGFAEQAINAIYALSEHPDIVCGSIIKILAARIFDIDETSKDQDECIKSFQKSDGEKMDVDEEKELPNEKLGDNLINSKSFYLSKLCFLVGHVAIKQIVHLEIIESEWKLRKSKEDHSKTPRRAGGDDLDLVTGTADDEFTEAIGLVRERELLYGENSLLALFGPLIVFICRNNTSYNDPILQTICVLSLCKLMCISAEFCDSNLQLLFTILEKSAEPIIKSNIIIGLGDMAICFNSLIDQNISYVYNRLNDPDPVVKKNTLMVLTHLILNGMVKVKGQISEMAKCLQDEDTRMSDLAKLFFTELSTKDNAVYNNLPDIISNLSACTTKTEAGVFVEGELKTMTGVDEESFKKIMEFLFSFVKKAAHLENLVEKLCYRFQNAKSERQWRDIAFCLFLIPFSSDKSFKKLAEALPFYQEKLHEDDVYKYITDIISKAKKLPKADTKAFVEEFEKKIIEFRFACVDAVETTANANEILSRKKKGRKSVKVSVKVKESKQSDEDDDEIVEEMENLSIKTAPITKKRATRTKPTPLPKVKEWESENDDEEVEEDQQEDGSDKELANEQENSDDDVSSVNQDDQGDSNKESSEEEVVLPKKKTKNRRVSLPKKKGRRGKCFIAEDSEED